MKYKGRISELLQLLKEQGQIVEESIDGRLIKLDNFIFICEPNKHNNKRYVITTIIPYEWYLENIGVGA